MHRCHNDTGASDAVQAHAEHTRVGPHERQGPLWPQGALPPYNMLLKYVRLHGTWPQHGARQMVLAKGAE